MAASASPAKSEGRLSSSMPKRPVAAAAGRGCGTAPPSAAADVGHVKSARLKGRRRRGVAAMIAVAAHEGTCGRRDRESSLPSRPPLPTHPPETKAKEEVTWTIQTPVAALRDPVPPIDQGERRPWLSVLLA